MVAADKTDPDDESSAVFEAWRERVALGVGEDFDALCRAHPRLRDALVSRKASWERLMAALEEDARRTVATAIGDAPVIEVARFIERLRRRGASWSRYARGNEVGRGGMGEVFLVFDEDTQRNLAMKVMRDAGAGSSSSPLSVGRFLEEAQITAQLDHPGVVPIHEVGLDDDGQLFFTMKLVKGEDLRAVFSKVARGVDGWNLARAVSVLQRVCEAMSYAHAKGVIHRDLKPANVMVGRFGETYVMDWGLARVLGQTATVAAPVTEGGSDHSLVRSLRRASPEARGGGLTEVGAVVGTPQYMSPEQAAGEVDEVGPATDIYAVGAMLYHLLAGAPPYAGVGGFEALAQVLERAPPPLVHHAGGAPPELVAICEKAMARAARDRYATMADLSEDLRAYLETRVVRAYATGPVHELRKWVARNRALAASIAAALLIATSAGFVLAWQRDRAAANIERERDVTRAVADFQQEMLRVDAWDDGSQVSAVELARRASERIDGAYPGRPDIEVAVRLAIADTFTSLGDHDAAETQRRAAYDLSRETLGPDHPDTLRAATGLVAALSELGRHRDAESLARDTLTRTERVFGPRHEPVASVRAVLALALLQTGDLAEAEVQQRLVLDDYQRRDPGSSAALRATAHLAAILHEQGRLEEAERLDRAVLEGRQRLLGDDAADTVTAKNNLADALVSLGRVDEAIDLSRDALSTARARLDGDHPLVLRTASNLASWLARRGRYREAIPEMEALIDALQTAGDAGTALAVKNNLALALRGDGRAEESLRVLIEVADEAAQRFGPQHPNTLAARESIAVGYVDLGRLEEAARSLRDLLKVRSEVAPGHVISLMTRHNLVSVLLRMGSPEQLEEAESLNEGLADAIRSVAGPSDPRVLRVVANQADILARTGRAEAGLALLDRVLAEFATSVDASDVRVLDARRLRASILDGLGRPLEAIAELCAMLDVAERSAGAASRDTTRIRLMLAGLLRQLDRYDDAVAAIEHGLVAVGDEAAARRDLLKALVDLLDEAGRSSEAAARRSELDALPEQP